MSSVREWAGNMPTHARPFACMIPLTRMQAAQIYCLCCKFEEHLLVAGKKFPVHGNTH